MSSSEFPAWRDAATDVVVFLSQYGYHPDHPKIITTSVMATEFTVCDSRDDQVVFRGQLRDVHGDFGTFRQGDFSALTACGTYVVRVENFRSPGTFTIDPHRWDDLLKASAWYYFGLRRMGEDNILGNLGDFRLVNWEHARIPGPDGTRYKYLGRAWADGDDGRIYPSASLVVAQYCALKDTNPAWDQGDWIYQQVRWGLDGTLSFLEKDGQLRYLQYFMDHQWETYDNRFYSGDEKPLVDAFDGESTAQEYDGSNPEIIMTSLLLGPAYAVALFRERDPDFFARVAALVQRGYDAIQRRFRPYPQKYSLGAWVWLNLLMARITGDAMYRDRAVHEADRFLALQQREWAGDTTCQARGWFRRNLQGSGNPWGEKPEQEVMLTPWTYQALFQLRATFPEHPRRSAWEEAIRSYAADYLMPIAQRNAFGYTPMKVEAPTLKRMAGPRSLSYQYFGAIGRQFHQIGNAAFLLAAGKALHDHRMVQSAWQQLFWFSGHNPRGYGLIHGFATNCNSGQYYPDTLGRAFPGGTINGAVGDPQDHPNFEKYHEYYTYGNVNVLWFATVAGATRFSRPLELWPKEIQESPHTAQPDQHPRASFPVRLKGGQTYPFMAVAHDATAADIEWLVDGLVGGHADVGTISSTGVYQAPNVATERRIVIQARLRAQPEVHDTTSATIMPVPGACPTVTLHLHHGQAQLQWHAAPGPVTGYTIWKRLPVGPDHVGTIFEMVGATTPDVTTYSYPNAQIHHYEDHLLPPGTEFLVKAYHAHFDPHHTYVPDGKPYSGLSAGWMRTPTPSPERIYGFGPASAIVTVPTT